MIKILTFLFFILVSFSAIAGGGWTYIKGKGFVKIGLNAIEANKYYSQDGSLINIPSTFYYAYSLYAEYGVSNKLTAIVYMPFFSRVATKSSMNPISGEEVPGDELNSFGDMDLSLQYGFLKGEKWVASARVLFGLPTGNDSGGDTGILQTRDGEFNQMLQLDVSRGLGKVSWMSVYAGYNNRTKGFSDDYRFGAEVGTKFLDMLYVIAKLDIVQSTENGDVATSQGGTLFSNNTEYVSPSLEVAYQNEKQWGVSVSVAGAFEGQNVLAAPNYAVGIFRKF